MLAGIARVGINPPLGVPMAGFSGRDRAQGCQSIHDDIFVRAVYLEHDGRKALILGFDLLFFSRAQADRLKGAIGRQMDLSPRHILLNTSHTHAAPAVGSWAFQDFTHPPDKFYLDQVEQASVTAAHQARRQSQPATLWAGRSATDLPVSRRYVDSTGYAHWRPDPQAQTYNHMPVILLRQATQPAHQGLPIALLFSVSCHPSTINSWAISADYPGAAMAQLDAALGGPVSLFLQGCGGDSKARVIAQGPADDSGLPTWAAGTWDDVQRAGQGVARCVLQTLDQGLRLVEPGLHCAVAETLWPLQPPPSRCELEAYLYQPDLLRRLWAAQLLQRLKRGETLPQAAPVQIHLMELAHDLRLVGLEGEAVADWGHFIDKLFDQGINMPMGYTNGQGLYLPTQRMLPEGGYEVESAYEYGFPAGLVPGYEAIVTQTLQALRAWA